MMASIAEKRKDGFDLMTQLRGRVVSPGRGKVGKLPAEAIVPWNACPAPRPTCECRRPQHNHLHCRCRDRTRVKHSRLGKRGVRSSLLGMFVNLLLASAKCI